MFKQNESIASSVLEKIQKQRGANMNPLKVFDDLTELEMRELLLYCLYPAVKNSYYPDEKLFPKVLSFYRDDPRLTDGPQTDTRLLLKSYFHNLAPGTQKNVATVADTLFREANEKYLVKADKVLEDILFEIDLFNSQLWYGLIQVDTLRTVFGNKKLPFWIRRDTVCALADFKGEWITTPPKFWIDVAKEGHPELVLEAMRAFMRDDDLVKTEIIKCFSFLKRWWENDFLRLVTTETLCKCIEKMQGEVYIMKRGKNGSKGYQITDFLILEMKRWDPRVRRGFAKFIKNNLLNHESSVEELGRWIKKKSSQESICIINARDAKKLHAAAQRILAQKKKNKTVQ